MRKRQACCCSSWLGLLGLLLAVAWLAQAANNELGSPGLSLFDPSRPDSPHGVPLPMRSMVIRGQIVDAVAEVTLTQEFETTYQDAATQGVAVYRLPLFEQAAVTQFKAFIGKRVIEGRVFEKQDARQQFNEAIDAGKSAFLAEQVTADIFTISVGNLPPQQIVRIEIVYLTPLKSLGAQAVRFRLPTGIAPRYEPSSGPSLPDGQDFLYSGVLIELQARMSQGLTQVISPTHEISTRGGLPAGRASVTVLDEDPLQRDLVVTFQMPTSAEPQIYVEQSDVYGTMAMMLSLVPDLPPAATTGAPPQEYIFVVDRSGSMEDKVVQVRLALRQVLELLPTGTLFNFVGYGSSFTPLFDTSQLIDTHLAQGLEYAKTLNADMGGTEVLGALQFVLTLAPNADYQRRIFLFTDGQVSNTQQVISYVAANIGQARIYTLGIGAHASTELVNGVARAGLGSAEFVDGTSAQAVQMAVESQMDAALVPALTDIQLDWGLVADAGDSQQSPYIFPLLAQGKRFLMFYISSVRTPPIAVSLSARIAGTEQSVDFTVLRSSTVFLNDESGLNGNNGGSNGDDDDNGADGADDGGAASETVSGNSTAATNSTASNGDGGDDGGTNDGLTNATTATTKTTKATTTTTSSMIHKMAGRSLIRDLEEGRSKLHAERKTDEEMRAEIVRLGLLYQLASSETSFLAIDDGEPLANRYVDGDAEDEADAARGSLIGGSTASPRFGSGDNPVGPKFALFIACMLAVLLVFIPS